MKILKVSLFIMVVMDVLHKCISAQDNIVDPSMYSNEIDPITRGAFDMDSDLFETSTWRLRLVQSLFRHGDRSPIHSYAKDIYTEKDWPQGYGQLSKVGMQQGFELGEFLKETYVNRFEILSAKFNKTDVYVRSTSFDMALMSAYSVLAGLFPPVDAQKWHPDISWQPIPVHTVPLEKDYLLNADTSCPVLDRENAANMHRKYIINEVTANYEELFKYISINSGEPNSWKGISTVFDPIFCQYVSNYTLPIWVTPYVMGDILDLMDFYATISVAHELSYLHGGFLVQEMLQNMLNKSKNKETSILQKLILYSAHDATINHFLKTLHIFNDKQPPYAACVIVELFESHTGEYYVKISYRNETYNDPYIFSVPGCGEFCPLELFAHKVKAFVPDDVYSACGVKEISFGLSQVEQGVDKLTQVNNNTAIIVVVLLISVMFVTIIVLILCIARKNKKHDYLPVALEIS